MAIIESIYILGIPILDRRCFDIERDKCDSNSAVNICNVAVNGFPKVEAYIYIYILYNMYMCMCMCMSIYVCRCACACVSAYINGTGTWRVKVYLSTSELILWYWGNCMPGIMPAKQLNSSPPYNMNTILQTIFSYVFSSMKMLESQSKCPWNLLLRVKLTKGQHWVR